MERFRRDSTWTGVLLGFFVPAILFGILYGTLMIVEHYTGKIEAITIQKLILLSVVPNLFLLRYYLLKLKYDLTGRGIMGMTFVIAILFAVLEFAL